VVRKREGKARSGTERGIRSWPGLEGGREGGRDGRVSERGRWKPASRTPGSVNKKREGGKERREGEREGGRQGERDIHLDMRSRWDPPT